MAETKEKKSKFKDELFDALIGFSASPEQFKQFYEARQGQEKEKQKSEFETAKTLFQKQSADDRMREQQDLINERMINLENLKRFYGQKKAPYQSIADIPEDIGGMPRKRIKSVAGGYSAEFGVPTADERIALRQMAEGEEKVRVTTPEGDVGFIPKKNLEKARARGFR